MSKSTFTDIKAKIDYLPLTVRLLVVFVLGFCTNSVLMLTQYSVLYSALVYCLPLFLAVLITASLQRQKEKVLAGLSWAIGGTLPIIFVILESIFTVFFFNLLAWLFFQCLVQYAISRNKKEFNYWKYIIIWLLIFYFSLSFKYLMVFALFNVLLVRAYQIYFSDDLSKIKNKGFIFSFLFPYILGFSLFGYAYYKNTEQRELADKVVQQIISYGKKHGEYPPIDSFADYKESSQIYYYIGSDNIHYVLYKEFIPAEPYCRYLYNFKTQNWDRYCDLYKRNFDDK
ncbi:hypothetical protein [Psychrobacter sp. I-STPA6b]|uniref:hypothetical protein n=1 Tax=Psychrobacter sp. I-STPA6b TaxID=2585718 RepID=UPI001D0C9F04|nr:hypothetical protein [Psychrobacter sp. I-STPA6b]